MHDNELQPAVTDIISAANTLCRVDGALSRQQKAQARSKDMSGRKIFLYAD